MRGLNESTEAAGGALVPEQHANEVITAMSEMSVLRNAGARTLNIAGTDEFKLPRLIYGGEAQLTSEEQAYAELTPSTEQLTLRPYKLTKITKASEEVATDSRVDLAREILMPDAIQAFSEAENRYFITGTGASQPQGILNGASLGVTAAATGDIQADELIDLVYSLQSEYRDGAVFLMNDTTAAYVRKLKSGSGDYLWQDSLQFGQPPTLLGYRIFTSSKMPTISTGNKAIIFGNLRYFLITDFAALSVQYLDQLYASTGQVAWRWFKRTDSRVLLPEAIKYLELA
jgi:HK97 family phage major capsid protein